MSDDSLALTETGASEAKSCEIDRISQRVDFRVIWVRLDEVTDLLDRDPFARAERADVDRRFVADEVDVLGQ